MDISTVLVACVVILVLWLLCRRPSSLPPGPPLLPVIGNLLSLEADPRVAFSKLRRKYGDVFCVYIFHKPFIVLNGYSAIKDALVKQADVFSDRPHSLFTEIIGQDKGVVCSSGPVWKEQRKFALTTLRDLGMGKSVIEDRIQEELVVFLKALEDEQGKAFDASNVIVNAVSNIVCSVVFGKRYEYSDHVFQSYLMNIRNLTAAVSASGLSNVFPALTRLPGDLFKLKPILKLKDEMVKDLVGGNLKEHMTSSDENKDDFITAYIEEMKLRQEKDPNTTLNMANMETVTLDLFLAGTETTSTTLRWTILYFLNFPEIQQKCFQEIKEKIGLNRSPCMKDKVNLPYVEATIHEVLRRADIAPTAVPHTVPEDVEFRGYVIPKGATVIPMLDSVLQDPDVWGDPENVRPERFLDADGKFQKKEEFIPFSTGRRVCLGESLARMELFLFLTSMVQRFEFLPADGVKPTLVGIIGFAHSPKPFKVVAKLRE